MPIACSLRLSLDLLRLCVSSRQHVLHPSPVQCSLRIDFLPSCLRLSLVHCTLCIACLFRCLRLSPVHRGLRPGAVRRVPHINLANPGLHLALDHRLGKSGRKHRINVHLAKLLIVTSSRRRSSSSRCTRTQRHTCP